jgi:hypothetical protein
MPSLIPVATRASAPESGVSTPIANSSAAAPAHTQGKCEQRRSDPLH